MDQDTIDRLLTALSNPRSFSADGISTSEHSLREQIELIKYLEAEKAKTARKDAGAPQIVTVNTRRPR